MRRKRRERKKERQKKLRICLSTYLSTCSSKNEKKKKKQTYLRACTFGEEDEEEKPYPEAFPKMTIVIRKERERSTVQSPQAKREWRSACLHPQNRTGTHFQQTVPRAFK
jgi:hypothetical protein